MATKDPWHLQRSSSLLGGTITSWCGQTFRKKAVEKRGWFSGGKTCPACVQAKKNGRSGR